MNEKVKWNLGRMLIQIFMSGIIDEQFLLYLDLGASANCNFMFEKLAKDSFFYSFGQWKSANFSLTSEKPHKWD